MDSYERVIRSLKNQRVDRSPIFPMIGDHAGIINGLSYRDMYKDPKKAAKAHLNAIKLYGYDILTIQVEPSWPVAEACGAEVNYPQNKNPWIKNPIIHSVDDVKGLKLPNFLETQSTFTMIEGTKILSQNSNYPVAAFMSGPLTFCFQLLSYKKMLKYLVKNPEMVKNLLKKVIKIIIAYIKSLQKSGAEICVICEHDLQMISPTLSKVFCFDYLSEILMTYKYNILHICGKVRPHLEILSHEHNLLEKLSAISIGPHMSISETQKLFNYEIGIAGNIDHFKLLTRGSPQEIQIAVHKAIEANGDDPRFMIAPGCEITADTPIENVKAFMNAAKNYF